ncbi:MAG: response regulator [Cyanobacteria bacterium P01_G01_bin.19]
MQIDRKPTADKPTILVVENDEDNLIYISQAIALLGYRSITSQDSRNCLDLVLKHRPDLIILDIKMPYLSGIDLVKMLRANWLTRNIPVVAVTALTKDRDKKLILNVGFKAYLIKPFYLEDFEQIVVSNIAKDFCS